MRVAALTGSLRAASTNTAFLGELARSAPAGIEVRLHERLAEIPPFDPDRDPLRPPPADRHGAGRPTCAGDEALAALVELVRGADAVVVACPEYAGAPLAPGALARDAAPLGAVRGSLEALARAVRGTPDSAPPAARPNPGRPAP